MPVVRPTRDPEATGPKDWKEYQAELDARLKKAKRAA